MQVVRELRAYCQVALASFREATAYRGELLLRLCALPVFATIYYCIWRAVYHMSGKSTLEGVTLDQMITYATLGQIIAGYMEMETIFEIESRIRSGDIVVDLSKPYDLQWYFLARSAGKSILVLALQLPFAAALLLLLIGKVPLPLDGMRFLGFIGAVVVSFLTVYSFNFVIGVLGFWIWETEAVDRLQYTLMFFLSGSLVPLWFYPEVLERLGEVLPYKWIYQVPMGIYIGKIGRAEMALNLAVGAIWCSAIFWVGRILYRLGIRHLRVQGG